MSEKKKHLHLEDKHTHALAFCAKCDKVYCEGCDKEWNSPTTTYPWYQVGGSPMPKFVSSGALFQTNLQSMPSTTSGPVPVTLCHGTGSTEVEQ